jgi:hypothetical protein
MRSASGRSTEVYQVTLPSFLAASINAGVIAVGSGAEARNGAAKTEEAASVAEPLRMPRRENLRLGIATPPDLLLVARTILE